MTNNEDYILGFFVKVGFDPTLSPQEFLNLANTFRPYLSGDKGISHELKKLRHGAYGKDLILALLQFYLKPTAIELTKIRPIESYRTKEKAIGIPIVVNEENFFSKSETERKRFLRDSILQKLDLLAEVVKKKKLDTNVELLKSDVERVLDQFIR